MVLNVAQLSITVGDATIVDGCSFSLGRGEMGLVSGPSGSGKTALGLACCGLLGSSGDEAMVTGTISLFDNPVVQGTLDSRTGVVLENPYAQVSGMKRTVVGELAFSLECRGISAREIPARTDRMLDMIGLSHLAEHAIDTLSGGELVRVIIGAALIVGPRFLFLDRPLTELDQSFRLRLLDILRQHVDSCDGAVLIAEDPWLLGDTVFECEVSLGSPVQAAELSEPIPVFHHIDIGKPALTIEDLTFSYEPGEPLIRSFSCLAMEGGVVFIEGPNGAGKTTLAKLATGLLAPETGRIFIGEDDAAAMTLDERIALIGYAPQNPGLVFCRRTVREELALAAKWGNDPTILVPYLGLDRFMDEHPLELSRAMQKRLGIALAYGPSRKVVILDEPSQYQDYAGFEKVTRALHAMTERGVAVMVISHDPRFREVSPDAPVTRLVRGGSG